MPLCARKLLSFLFVGSATVAVAQNNPSSSTYANDDIDIKNLTAVIHIGPMKTGSSAIQSSLGKVYSTLKDIDRYEDAGFAMDSGIETYHMIGCFRPDAVPYTGRTDRFEISCHPDALHQVSRIADRNHHVIITAEYLTDPKTNLRNFKEFLRPWKHHYIVAYYRRYYEWLLSFHNQIYKQHETPYTRKTIPEFLMREKKYHFFWENMYLNKAIERYQAANFTNIRIINTYEQKPDHDVRESFYCQGLINASATCQAFRNMKNNNEMVSSAKSANPTKPLIYHELAYYAKEMQLWNDDADNSLSVNDVTQLAQEYDTNRRRRKLQEQNDSGGPSTSLLYEFHDSGAFICPSSDVYVWLLETSLMIEKELFPNYYTQYGEDEMIEHFNMLVHTKRFCHIDAKLILQNDYEWRYFFENLSTVQQ